MATSGDRHLATSGDFFMATDNAKRRTASWRVRAVPGAASA